MIINHNLSALAAYNGLSLNQSKMAKALSKLSSGLRINNAADDAAGLAISEKMRAQIRGLDQAARNSQDAVSLIQTAEGALNETHSMLQRMRELSVQASNDTLTSQDRSYIQLEIDQLKDEIDRTATTTQFNKRNLLDGTSAAIWSSDKLSTEAIIRGELSGRDQFGQKISAEGNYRIEIIANPGAAEVLKSNLLSIAGDIAAENVTEPTAPLEEPTETIDIGTVIDGDSGAGWSVTGSVLTISSEGTYRITGQTNINTVNVASNANILLSGVNIDVSGSAASCAFAVSSGAAVNIYIDNANSLKSGSGRAGLEVTDGNAVTITSAKGGDASFEGELTVAGGNYAAGIGGLGNIGSTDSGTAGSITINGGTITANGGRGDIYNEGGAGIGGGNTGSTDGDGGGVITINGGKITAKGGEGSAGIGSAVNAGYDPVNNTIGDGGTKININGGTINATGTDSFVGNEGGAGIGGGAFSNSGVVTIKGGSITAKGGSGAEDIGRGYEAEVSSVLWKTHNVKENSLNQVEQLYDGSGRFLLADPQTITIYQGDGKSTSVTLYASDTMRDVAQKINYQIAYSLGQGDYVDDISKFCTLSDGTPGTSESIYRPDSPIYDGNGRVLGYEKYYATMIIRSAVVGKAGELKFSGDEELLKALGFSTIQASRESTFYVSVYDAHDGEQITSMQKITGNVLNGAITENVDVSFDPLANTNVTWNEGMKRFDFTNAGGSYTTFVHLSDQTMTFQTGANENEDLTVAIENMSARALGVHNVLVIDQKSAARAITMIDNAIDRVSKQRASLGAYQNRLEHTITNLAVASENLTASESRIRDLDMAKEMMNFTKLNILIQAGSAMLGQANQLPNNVLSLLR